MQLFKSITILLTLLIGAIVVCPGLAQSQDEPPSDEQIAEWISHLAEEMEAVRWGSSWATNYIPKLTDAGELAVPGLIKELEDGERRGAVYVLRSIGPDAAKAVPVLKKLALEEAGQNIVEYLNCFEALTSIIPDDPSLGTLAGELAIKGEHCAQQYIYYKEQNNLPLITSVVQGMEYPPHSLLRLYVEKEGDVRKLEHLIIQGLSHDHLPDMKGPEKLEWSRNRKESYEKYKYNCTLRLWAIGILFNNKDDCEYFMRKWSPDIDSFNEQMRVHILEYIWVLGQDALPVLNDYATNGTENEKKATYGSRSRIEAEILFSVDDLSTYLDLKDDLNSLTCTYLMKYGDTGLDKVIQIAKLNRKHISHNAAYALRMKANIIGPDIVGIMYDLLIIGEPYYPRDEAYRFFRLYPMYHDEIESFLPRIESLLSGDDEILAEQAFWIICRRRYHKSDSYGLGDVGTMLRNAADDPNPIIQEKVKYHQDKISDGYIQVEYWE